MGARDHSMMMSLSSLLLAQEFSALADLCNVLLNPVLHTFSQASNSCSTKSPKRHF